MLIFPGHQEDLVMAKTTDTDSCESAPSRARQSRAGPGSKRITTSKRPPASGRSRSASPTRDRNQRERSRSQERPREGGRAGNEYDDEDAEGEEDEDYD